MKIFLLDMGSKIYGDCLLVTEGQRRILIDGAHPGDWRPSPGTLSIPQQLEHILGAKPFNIDLLVVTHCHSDHIGCLPKLVADGTVKFEWALVADEKLGFPTDQEDAVVDDATRQALAAFSEEPQPDLEGPALDEFLADAAKLSDNYRTMLETLENNHTHVIRYSGPDSAKEIERRFSDFHLRVLGPSSSQLTRCSEVLAKVKQSARDALDNIRRVDLSLSAAQLYRLLTSRKARLDAAVVLPDDLTAYLDRAGAGAALNDQSVVLKLGDGDETALLTGDMQLAKPEISGLDDEMDELLSIIKKEGPYKFVKLPHHASYNGFDENVLDVFKETPAFGISTGRGDPNDPDSGVLALLKSVRSEHEWARTDRNGSVTVSFEAGKIDMAVAKRHLNDSTPNASDELPAVEQPISETKFVRSEAPVSTPVTLAGGEPSVASVVEVFTRVPHVKTRVTVTIDVAPQESAALELRAAEPPAAVQKRDQPVSQPRRKLADGRSLPRLLFVTNSKRLGENIGRAETQDALSVIKGADQFVIDSDNKTEIFSAIQNAYQKDKSTKGVVILGGYDVVLSERVDALPPSIRALLGTSGEDDPDDFTVWSDQSFGDVDGDGLADIAVSRIPDGRSAKLVQMALYGCAAAPNVQRFGLRNFARPFADSIYAARVAGSENMLTSKQTRSQSLDQGALNAKLIYLMLHGSDTDCSRFWGETQGGMLEAMYVGSLPDQCGAVVFSGCCWGALTVRTRALLYREGDPIQSLPPEQSIALSFLERGARAFVGCTGAHYSPVNGNLNYFGAPIHDRFWAHFSAGSPPAEALFAAKINYIGSMPHGRKKVEELAIENKILRQFTCLGLGW